MNWREFVEDDNNRGSSARLCMVYGVFIGSIVVLWMAYQGNLGGEVFATFMLASGGVYVWGKTRESIERVERTKAVAPQPVAVPVPVAPLGPTTVIQVGEGKATKDVAAKDVNVVAEGDVHVDRH